MKNFYGVVSRFMQSNTKNFMHNGWKAVMLYISDFYCGY